MSTVSCPICNADTPDQYNFCTSCDKQIKCLNPDCNKLLVAGKTFCFTCGQPIPSISTELGQPNQPNRYFKRVTQRGDDFDEITEWNASDDAVRELAPFIVEGMTIRPRTIYRGRNNGPTTSSDNSPEQREIAGTEQRQLPPMGDESQADQSREDAAGAAPQEKREVKDGAARYFERDGDALALKKKDFKGKTFKEQQRNYVLVYTAAYRQVFGKPVPSREHLNEIARSESIYDRNFPNYLTQLTRRELREVSSGFTLTDDGEKEVTRILALMSDDKLTGHPYWDRNAGTPTRKQRASKDDKTKIKEWAQKDVELGKLHIRDITASLDFALVACWVLTVHLKVVNAVKWTDAYQYMKEKFETISANSDKFRLAMTRNEKHFRKNDEQQYYLTADGQKRVEDLIANGLKSTAEK
jgi:hypothetical protein